MLEHDPLVVRDVCDGGERGLGGGGPFALRGQNVVAPGAGKGVDDVLPAEHRDGPILKAMTQTHTPAPSIAWCQALQAKLMAALDAAWAILDRSDDPAEIRRARDKAKAIGDLAAMARKVALIVPMGRASPASGPAAPEPFQPDLTALALAPVAAQAEHARRALEKLKGGRRGRL